MYFLQSKHSTYIYLIMPFYEGTLLTPSLTLSRIPTYHHRILKCLLLMTLAQCLATWSRWIHTLPALYCHHRAPQSQQCSSCPPCMFSQRLWARTWMKFHNPSLALLSPLRSMPHLWTLTLMSTPTFSQSRQIRFSAPINMSWRFQFSNFYFPKSKLYSRQSWLC